MSEPTAFPLDESKLPFKIPKDTKPREKIMKLGQMITDRVPAKLRRLTVEDPEYWGLASIVTDEMADVALKMKVRQPMTLPELEKATGKPAKELEPLLYQMSCVGLLEYNWENPRREKQYILPMFVPGSAEFFNMNKQQIADHPEVTAFFERMTFLPLEHITAMVPPGGAGIGMHVIPVEKAIETENHSLDIEHISHWLKKYQDKLFKLQNLCYQKKIPVIICYEGWDAAGKGGNIKRIAAALDPRGYEVHPISAPEPSELARHYLWRFWKRLEKNGHFTIFDRTWYGRVMVEPIEKLTPEERVNMAYREINEFESQLHDWGAEIIKFWVNVDKDEQLRRFNERENTPEKRWKITDEDWRNREKWDTYEKYVDRMITLTSTDIAPWTILEGNDKKYARIKALKTIVKRLEKRLEKEDK